MRPLWRGSGGAVGGGVTAAVGTVLMGGNMDSARTERAGRSHDRGGSRWGCIGRSSQNPLSLRTAAESQGGGGSGAEKNEDDSAGADDRGASYGQDGGDKTLLMWNDIEYSDRQQASDRQKSRAFEAK